MKISAVILLAWLLTACSAQNISDYAQASPVFSVENFFNGPLEAQGIVLDRGGKVTRRFVVKMLGSWEEQQGTLQEWFTFADGEKSTRTWTITKHNDGRYSGIAEDIVGQARGESGGFAVHWDYQLDLSVAGDNYRVTFNDWLYQVDDKVVINRSYITKWGFRVGEVILVITKQ